jgi:hypothetical protein
MEIEYNRTTICSSPRLQVEGQTRGEWISLGTYALLEGTTTTVTITTKDANGNIATDAILFVPVK